MSGLEMKTVGTPPTLEQAQACYNWNKQHHKDAKPSKEPRDAKHPNAARDRFADNMRGLEARFPDLKTK